MVAVMARPKKRAWASLSRFFETATRLTAVDARFSDAEAGRCGTENLTDSIAVNLSKLRRSNPPD